MPAKLLPDAEVSRLLRSGLTQTQVSEYLEQHHDIRVSPNAISIWARRAGLPRKRPATPVDLIPWRIKPEHRFKQAAWMLRAEARIRRGEELPARAAVSHANWRRRLAEDDLVVAYDPDTEEGFTYVPRREGDLELIRMPNEVTALPSRE